MQCLWASRTLGGKDSDRDRTISQGYLQRTDPATQYIAPGMARGEGPVWRVLLDGCSRQLVRLSLTLTTRVKTVVGQCQSPRAIGHQIATTIRPPDGLKITLVSVCKSTYGPAERDRILAEFRRPPDRQRDGTATRSLNTLQRALRRAPDGLPKVSTYTHLGGTARRRHHLAARPYLVPDRRGHPQAQAWRGQSPGSGRQREKG
jgi:hypothetical protein